jgi:hypothetical protein
MAHRCGSVAPVNECRDNDCERSVIDFSISRGRGLASALADLLFPGLEAGIGSIFFRQDRAGGTYSGFRGNV